MTRWLAGLLFLAVSTTAFAQAPPSANVRVVGVLTAVSSTKLTVKGADGASTELSLAKTYTVVKTRPIDIEAIKPGSFVATANTNIDATSGKSIELRVFEPGVTAGEGSRPMAQPNTTMTNGTVQTVSKGAGGRELEVAYPGGVRHIIVPPDVQVIGSFPAQPSELKPGVSISTNVIRAPSGDLIATRITITKP